jgi:hypothetical protein
MIITEQSCSHDLGGLLLGAVVSSPATYDFGLKQYEQGASIHILCIGSFTAEYRSLLKGNTNTTFFYYGIGIGHLLQFQYGSQGSIRIRSDLALFNTDSPFFNSFAVKGHIRDGIILTIIIEDHFEKKEFPWLLGVGIGFYF